MWGEIDIELSIPSIQLYDEGVSASEISFQAARRWNN